MMVIGAATYIEIDSARIGRATALFSTIQQLTMSLGVTLGVWAISGMRLFYATGEHDNRIYGGSIVILALLATIGLATTRKLDVEATGALRKSA